MQYFTRLLDPDFGKICATFYRASGDHKVITTKRFGSIVVLIETVFRERNQYEYGNGTYTNIAFGTSAPVPSKHAKVSTLMLMRL